MAPLDYHESLGTSHAIAEALNMDITDRFIHDEKYGYIGIIIHCHIDNDYGRKRFEEVIEYASQTNMSLIGVSHAASEYLVKKTLMAPWFEENFDLETINLIPQKDWWL